MTWSLSNTIPFSTNADSHTAMVYLFDTALSGLSTWTVSAHPDASTFKRTIKRTTTSILTNASYEEHFWANWTSDSNPTSLFLYEDATYTTVPGDLGTDTTNQQSSSFTPFLSTESWKFWTSDQNANALLVTRGTCIMFWEPGWTSAFLMEDPSWDGSADSLRTQIFPATNATLWGQTGWPGSFSASSSTEHGVVPALCVDTSSVFLPTARLDMNSPFMFDGNTSGQPAAKTNFAFGGVGNDVGYYRGSVSSHSSRYFRNTSNLGELFLVDGRYYLSAYGQGPSYPSMVFDMGVTEPDFT